MPIASWATLVFAIDLVIRLLVAVRVVFRRISVSETFAWLLLVVAVPYAGAVIYLLVGEARLGRKRARKGSSTPGPIVTRLEQLRRDAPPMPKFLNPGLEPIHRQAEGATGFPPFAGNRLELLEQTDEVLEAIVRDVDAAEQTVHMEFYIWKIGGLADRVCESVNRAAKRGVECRILLDDVGSRRFLRSGAARDMRGAGVELVASLPANPLRAVVARLDLRNHRKIVIIDGRIGYCGSMNLGDASSFASIDSGIGPWFDAMVRLRGPVVEALSLVFARDWRAETGADIEAMVEHARSGVEPNPRGGRSMVQIVPSGPGPAPDAIHRMLLATAYNACRRLTMTTPYFVPDESMVTALQAAAQRGVEVHLIVPERVNSLLVRLASAAMFEELIEAGVVVHFFRDGLLHTKTVTVDGEVTLIGSFNIDQRSFWLNFELTMFAYDRQFTAAIDGMHARYIERSRTITLDDWRQRSTARRVVEHVGRLLSPIL